MASVTFDMLLRLQSCLNGWHLLIKRQYRRLWSNWCDTERVDLLVALGVMVLNVREFGRATESLVVPIAMPDPSA